LHSFVEANQLRRRRLTYNSNRKTVRVSAMFNSSELGDELQALKSEVLRLLNSDGDGVFDATKNRADALADQIKNALNELGETLSEQEDHVEALIAERPIATMASAFALGIVIGFILRRP
jgi:ElaB/YqjD/DUF883 family membrane-anchored ribosome-binding protein